MHTCTHRGGERKKKIYKKRVPLCWFTPSRRTIVAGTKLGAGNSILSVLCGGRNTNIGAITAALQALAGRWSGKTEPGIGPMYSSVGYGFFMTRPNGCSTVWVILFWTMNLCITIHCHHPGAWRCLWFWSGMILRPIPYHWEMLGSVVPGWVSCSCPCQVLRCPSSSVPCVTWFWFSPFFWF